MNDAKFFASPEWDTDVAAVTLGNNLTKKVKLNKKKKATQEEPISDNINNNNIKPRKSKKSKKRGIKTSEPLHLEKKKRKISIDDISFESLSLKGKPSVNSESLFNDGSKKKKSKKLANVSSESPDRECKDPVRNESLLNKISQKKKKKKTRHISLTLNEDDQPKMEDVDENSSKKQKKNKKKNTDFESLSVLEMMKKVEEKHKKKAQLSEIFKPNKNSTLGVISKKNKLKKEKRNLTKLEKDSADGTSPILPPIELENLKSTKKSTPKIDDKSKVIQKKPKNQVTKLKTLLKKMSLDAVPMNAEETDNLDDSNTAMLSNLNDKVKVKPEKAYAAKSLRERMMERLKGARFRYINEQMYIKQSYESSKIFQEDPESFKAYHDGYRQQVSKWPLNPLDVIISDILKLPKTHSIADMGCGDARLARSVPQEVFSFDLVALDPSVNACDMSHTPLLAAQVNVVVFCLSLMGTNLKDYLMEANRILKVGGMLKIAEVESRFENIDQFLKDLSKYGFSLIKKDLNNNLFYFMDFKKDTDVKKRNKVPQLMLNPCLYKKR